MKKNKYQNEIDHFQQYILEMDDALGRFISNANASNFILDYSLKSLEVLEELCLAQVFENDSGLREFQNSAARYLGEVFRKHVGGHWDLCLKSPNYLFFKLPVISEYSSRNIEFCPLAIIDNLMHKKELGMLRRAIDSHVPFKKSN